MDHPGAMLGLTLESRRLILEPCRLRISLEPRMLYMEPWRLSLEPRKLYLEPWRFTLLPWRFILKLGRLTIKLWRLNIEPWHLVGSLVYFWGLQSTFYHMSALYIHSRCNCLYIYNMDIQALAFKISAQKSLAACLPQYLCFRKFFTYAVSHTLMLQLSCSVLYCTVIDRFSNNCFYLTPYQKLQGAALVQRYKEWVFRPLSGKTRTNRKWKYFRRPRSKKKHSLTLCSGPSYC